ncbi:MAG: MerR family transcriptional regulator [Rhodanobacter sp.]
MLIGELAAASGLSREALRFYEKRGLIRSRRTPNGYRSYPPETAMLLDYIRTAQQLGFTLTEIGRELPQLWQADASGEDIAAIMRAKLRDIDERIAMLQALRHDLVSRIASDCPLQVTVAASKGRKAGQ